MANPGAQKTKISLRTKASKEGMGMIRPGTGLVNAAEDQPENSARQYRRRHGPWLTWSVGLHLCWFQ